MLDPAALIASRGGPKVVAEAVGVGRRTVHRWRTGETPLKDRDREAIERLPERGVTRPGRKPKAA